MPSLYRRRRFANYTDALAFRTSRIKLQYTTRLAKDWQGLYVVEYR